MPFGGWGRRTDGRGFPLVRACDEHRGDQYVMYVYLCACACHLILFDFYGGFFLFMIYFPVVVFWAVLEFKLNRCNVRLSTGHSLVRVTT